MAFLSSTSISARTYVIVIFNEETLAGPVPQIVSLFTLRWIPVGSFLHSREEGH